MDLFPVIDQGRLLYLDGHGTVRLETAFSWGDRFVSGQARVNCAGKLGFIDESGRIVIEPRFDKALPFSEGLARVELNRKWGLIDTQGHFVIEPRYAAVGDCSCGMIGVQETQFGALDYLDRNGRVIIKNQWGSVPGRFSEGLLAARLDNLEKAGYLDTRLVISHPDSEYGCELGPATI